MKNSKPDEIYLSYFSMELYLILKSGIPVMEGIEMLCEDEEDPVRKEALSSICERLGMGAELYGAFKESEFFPPYFIDMVEIGQRTGNLEKVFQSLADYYDREDRLIKQVKHAITYPAVLFFLMLFVISILIIKVLPIFNDVFVQMGSKMSPVAAALMKVGVTLSKWWIPLIILVVVIVAGVFFFDKKAHPDSQNLLQRIVFRKKVRKHIDAARFASAMAMALGSGLDVDQGLDLAARLVGAPDIKESVVNCKKDMLSGVPFSEAISKTGLFSKAHCRTISIGVTAGAADTVMAEIARRSEESALDEVDSTIGKIEPTLVIVLSVVTGVILLSVMIPLMGIMSSIG